MSLVLVLLVDGLGILELFGHPIIATPPMDGHFHTIQPDGAYGSDYFMVFGSDTRWTGGLSASGGQNFIGRGTPAIKV